MYQPGDTITYTISYDNLNNPIDVTGVIITDTLPSEVSFVSASIGGTLSGNTVTWDIGGAAQGDSGSVTLTVSINLGVFGGTTITNNCSIECDQTGPAYAVRIQRPVPTSHR